MTNQLALYSVGNRVEPFTSPCTARPSEEQRFQKLMQEHHYLGALPKISGYLNFPHVGQAFLIQRESTHKKSGEYSCEIAYGITSRIPEQADAQRVLATNRGHRSIENSCHYIIDWNYDEDRSRIRTGHGPENITRLRCFAISIIKSKGARIVAQKMRQLTRNVRLVFDYLGMTENACACAPND